MELRLESSSKKEIIYIAYFLKQKIVPRILLNIILLKLY